MLSTSREPSAKYLPLTQLTWKMEPEHLDYHLHLPIFFEGLR